jgi:hypothetical protein
MASPKRIDEVAGVNRPLLMSDLTAAGVNLQVMTTDLTHGRPMCFPFTGREFLFDPDQLVLLGRQVLECGRALLRRQDGDRRRRHRYSVTASSSRIL